MKVLHSGDINLEVSCQFCGARLQFEPEDVVHVDEPQCYAVVCPDCGKDVSVNILISDKTKANAERRFWSNIA